MSNQPHIAIIGGGLVGLSAALALAGQNRNIRLLEAGDYASPQPTGLDARSIALSYASRQIFKALGIWREVRKQASAIDQIHISSRGRWGVTRLRASDYQLEAMGYVVESHLLTGILLDRVRRCESISLETGAEFETLDAGDGIRLSYRRANKKHTLKPGLLIIADGARSKARSSLGVEHRSVDYQQAAIITNVEVSRPVSGVAYERFTEQGPLAMLPLGRSRYACVWTQKPQSADRLMQLEDQAFAESLEAAFGLRLGYIEGIGRRFSFPVYRTEALDLVKGGCLLIGNAANSLHPVAGQGLNLALRDVACLSHLLENQVIGEMSQTALQSLLNDYQTSRTAEQRRVVRLGDGLVSLFSNDLPILGPVRAGALALLDILPPLKAQVALAGMGFGSQGNPMLRGRLR